MEILESETQTSVALSPVKPKKRRSEASLEAKKERDRVRAKTRINIGLAFERWRELRDLKGFKSDAELAFILLDSYEKEQFVSTPVKPHALPAPILSTIGAESDREEDFLIPGVGVLESGDDVQALHESFTSMSIDEECVQIDEDQVNDLMNTVIDWEDETSIPSAYGDVYNAEDSSDEDYVPPLCVRMGGFLQNPVQIEKLPVVGLDETVHDAEDHTDSPVLSFPEEQHVFCEEDLIGKRASIVYDDNLRQLANFLKFPLHKCNYKHSTTGVECDACPPFELKLMSRGTAAVIEWFCSRGHSLWRWNSQPVFKYGMQAGDFMLATNILLSGNNYCKIALLLKFMNMGVVSKNTFFSIQDAYCVDAIKDFWKYKRNEVINRHRSKEEVIVLADGRMDSPGHCAQYCTYTTMENESKDIVHIVTMDKRETCRNSVIMEREAFIQTVDQLCTELKLTEICTDAHRQISALMDPVKGRYKDRGIFHSLDMWHGAKNLSKRLHAAGMVTGQHVILVWIKDVVNHFWYCCKTAENKDQFMNLWTSVLHHVVNRHTWACGRCQHDCLEGSQNKEWMQSGSAAHHALTKIVLDARWLKTIHKYLKFRSTAELESFQNHILMYANKRFAFSPPVYEARTLLAALDYNHHNGRPPFVNADGNKCYRRLYNKKSKRWSVYTLKTVKSYSYIPDLQRTVLQKRLSSDSGLPRRRMMRPNDPRRLGILPEVPPPPTRDLAEAQNPRGEDLT